MTTRLKWLPAAFCVVALGAASPALAAGPGQKAKHHAHRATAKATSDRDADDRAPMRFAAMDKNHDGKIERSEWRGTEKSFEEHDWNHDGVLSGDEVKPGATRPAESRPAAPGAKGTSGGGESDEVLFHRLDTNNDGRISREEWEAAKKSPRQFDALDTNHDGFLSPYEFGVGR